MGDELKILPNQTVTYTPQPAQTEQAQTDTSTAASGDTSAATSGETGSIASSGGSIMESNSTGQSTAAAPNTVTDAMNVLQENAELINTSSEAINDLTSANEKEEGYSEGISTVNGSLYSTDYDTISEYVFDGVKEQLKDEIDEYYGYAISADNNYATAYKQDGSSVTYDSEGNEVKTSDLDINEALEFASDEADAMLEAFDNANYSYDVNTGVTTITTENGTTKVSADGAVINTSDGEFFSNYLTPEQQQLLENSIGIIQQATVDSDGVTVKSGDEDYKLTDEEFTQIQGDDTDDDDEDEDDTSDSTKPAIQEEGDYDRSDASRNAIVKHTDKLNVKNGEADESKYNGTTTLDLDEYYDEFKGNSSSIDDTYIGNVSNAILNDLAEYYGIDEVFATDNEGNVTDYSDEIKEAFKKIAETNNETSANIDTTYINEKLESLARISYDGTINNDYFIIEKDENYVEPTTVSSSNSSSAFNPDVSNFTYKRNGNYIDENENGSLVTLEYPAVDYSKLNDTQKGILNNAGIGEDDILYTMGDDLYVIKDGVKYIFDSNGNMFSPESYYSDDQKSTIETLSTDNDFTGTSASYNASSEKATITDGKNTYVINKDGSIDSENSELELGDGFEMTADVRKAISAYEGKIKNMSFNKTLETIDLVLDDGSYVSIDPDGNEVKG